MNSGLSNQTPHNQRLDRHMGYVSGTLMGVGQIIGTGIFSNPSLILQNCGSGGMMLILWAIGAIFAGTGVWCYLELGTMLTRCGGEQEYLAYGFPRPKALLPFLFLMLRVVFGFSAVLTQGATVFGDIIMYTIYGQSSHSEWQARGFAVFCLTFWAIINICSAKLAIRVNNVFTILKIALLLLLIGCGFAGLAGRLPNKPDFSENFSFHGTTKSNASAIYYTLFAYSGWANLNHIIGELKDPVKNLPRCAISALSLTTILYLLANVAYLAVLPVSVIKASNLTVTSDFFNTAIGGVVGNKVIPVLVACSAFGSIGVIFYSGSRLSLEAARRGFIVFDHVFSRLNTKLQTPVNTTLLLYSISLIFLLAPPPGSAFQFVTAFAGYGQYFFCGMSVIGLIILRRTQPNVKRPYKVPYIVAAIFIAICIYSLVFVFIPPAIIPRYPYYLPYLVTIGLAVCVVGIWYYKAYYTNSFENSLNDQVYTSSDSHDSNDVFRSNTPTISNESNLPTVDYEKESLYNERS